MRRFIAGLVLGATLMGGAVGAADIAGVTMTARIFEHQDRVRVVLPPGTTEDSWCIDHRERRRSPVLVIRTVNGSEQCERWQERGRR